MSEPWAHLHTLADRLARQYNPGDDSEDIGRCDLAMLTSAVNEANEAMCLAQRTGPDPSAAAAGELLTALLAVLTGLKGDLRDIAGEAQALAGELARMHGPMGSK